MRNRLLLASLAVAPLTGGLLAAAPLSSAAPASPSQAPIVSTAGDLEAVVTAPVGGDWSVRFSDRTGTVVASVAHEAIGLETAAGRVLADHVVSVDGGVVELGTPDPALTATVSVTPDGDGVFAVQVAGHGDGVTGVSLDLKAPGGERYLGLGERSDAVDHRGKSVLNRVMDGPYTETQAEIVRTFVPEPGLGKRPDSTYYPIPWVLSTAGYGVLVDNDEDSTFDLATPEHRTVNRFAVESDELDLRVFGGPTPARALARMTAAIGRQPMLDTASVYGAWFQPRGDAVAQIDDQRDRGVAVSVAQTYVHYLPCGSQDTERERALTAALHERGVAVTTYFNPMVCQNYQPVYDQGLETNAFTRAADGSVLQYPYNTASHFEVSQIDFSAASGQALFKQLLQESVDDGYDGWMEDFGEYTPDDVISADGTPGPAMHNRYVEQYHATARDFEESAPRPLLRFQRSGWTDAVKESSIVWGGDPTTGWGFDGLTSSVTQGITMGTSGVTTWGPDIGGFMTLPGDPYLTPELLNRWIQYGAFTGVMRLQSGGIQYVGPTKPLVSDPEVEPVWKTYTRLRTMLYPYIAGSQDAYERSGLPLMRHLALVHPGDRKAAAADDEYLFGSDLLVAPVTTQLTPMRKVYLPRGKWLELAGAWNLKDTGRFTLKKAKMIGGERTVVAQAPLDTIPLFLRGGAVVPMLPRTVDTLSEYGDGTDVESLTDAADRRTLLAAPVAGTSRGTLGPDETLRSQVKRAAWTLRLDGAQARTYDLQATLTGLAPSWEPCRVEADGRKVSFAYDARTRVLTLSAALGADGVLEVTACR
ncbi:TIM-barrel domain-containing protein [Nocardioides sp. SR21]|uniref:TIM-barrel domain-containing protein n=1 Tax=Nocardioides sp. SR21 TaxID=2919501 RepID=UPI001FAAF825|nr:TIM-barrel domain-containing protein [Nocardioides sp. SR21]